MTSEHKTHFALEFFGQSVFLLNSHDDVNWQEIGLIDMSDPDFTETMIDFHAEVSMKSTQNAEVMVFLPMEDVVLDTVAVNNISNDFKAKSGYPITDASYVVGNANDAGQANILYAQRETLTEAANFIAKYGFVATAFSARINVTGFDQLPRLFLTQSTQYVAISAPSAPAKPAKMWPAAVVVLAVGVFGLWAFNQNRVELASTPTKQITPVVAQSTASLDPVLTQTKVLDPVQTEPTVTNTESKVMKIAALPQVLQKPPRLAVQNPISEPITTPEPSQVILPVTETISVAAALPKAAVEGVILSLMDAVDAEPVVSAPQTAATEPPTPEIIVDAVVIPQVESPQIDPELELPPTDSAVPVDANVRRPPLRSGKRIVAEDTSTEEPAVQLTSTINRPRRRPAGIAAQAASNATQAAIAQDLINQQITREQQVLTQLSSASLRAKGTNKRPPIKTSNFRRLVSNLQQAAKPVTISSSAKPPRKPAAVASAEPTASQDTGSEGNSRASTTFKRNALSLVGVFGTKSRRSALFRTSTGGYRTVKIGQRVGGWKVVAIGESTAKVTKGSRSKTMKIPE